MSQTPLARLLGIHQSAIAGLEAGERVPSLTTLVRLAQSAAARRPPVLPTVDIIHVSWDHRRVFKGRPLKPLQYPRLER